MPWVCAHVDCCLVYSCREPVSVRRDLRVDRVAFSVLQATLFGTGFVNSFPYEAGSFMKSSTSLDAPDIQTHFMAAPVFRQVIHKEVAPGPEFKTKAQLRKWLIDAAMTTLHPVGSCKTLAAQARKRRTADPAGLPGNLSGPVHHRGWQPSQHQDAPPSLLLPHSITQSTPLAKCVSCDAQSTVNEPRSAPNEASPDWQRQPPRNPDARAPASAWRRQCRPARPGYSPT